MKSHLFPNKCLFAKLRWGTNIFIAESPPALKASAPPQAASRTIWNWMLKGAERWEVAPWLRWCWEQLLLSLTNIYSGFQKSQVEGF